MSSMTPERWQRLKELFSQAVELAPEERAAFLVSACADDDKLRSEAEGLLASHERAGGFIEPPAADETPRGRIGPYEIVRELGRGGMGTVTLAVRADDVYRKEVAIKVIRRGMDTADVVRRFRNERQILAGLTHPNVAALLDGGTTDDGLPYFVMEHVEGEPIDVFCDGRRLSVARRLELFRAVCSAVQYAHQNLVVHRDLKPGNILVTAEGVPKLLDFGLAKILDPSGQGSEATVTQLRILTPAFASPEQIRGGPITTATDVYSLGVLLYLLLSGRRPYGSETTSSEELARAVCETEPPRPSAATVRAAGAATARGTTPVRLHRALAGDLDTIVLKALRKEPERRFASVEQLSEDLRRHLSGRPVSARSDGVWYRAGKFVRRHRLGVAAAAASAILLLAGVFEINRQRMRAERRFNDVRALANTFLFDFHDAIAILPGSTPARELVAKKGLEYIDSLAREARGDRTLQRELATAYERLGDVQGGRNSNLGDTAGAAESLRKAVSLREFLAASRQSGPEDRRALASAYDRLALILRARGDAGAEELQSKALTIRESLVSTAPTDLAIRRDLETSYGAAADLLVKRGDFAGALGYRRRSYALAAALAADQPEGAEVRRNLALECKYLGGLLEKTGDAASARPLYDKALALDRARVAAEPANAEAKLDLSFSYGALAFNQRNAGDLDGALAHYRKALALREAMLASDPANAWAKLGVARAHRSLAAVLVRRGDAEAALAENRTAAGFLEELLRADPSNAGVASHLAAVTSDLGDDEAALAARPAAPIAHWKQAREWYVRSRALYAELKRLGKLTATDEDNMRSNDASVAACDAKLAFGAPPTPTISAPAAPGAGALHAP